MKIPRTVKIGAHTILVDEVEFGDDSNLCGDNAYVEGRIRLNKALPQTQKEASFIHEAMHTMNTTLDHSLLDSLAEQMYQFLHDNDLLK